MQDRRRRGVDLSESQIFAYERRGITSDYVDDLCSVILCDPVLEVCWSVSMCRSQDNGERKPGCDT